MVAFRSGGGRAEPSPVGKREGAGGAGAGFGLVVVGTDGRGSVASVDVSGDGGRRPGSRRLGPRRPRVLVGVGGDSLDPASAAIGSTAGSGSAAIGSTAGSGSAAIGSTAGSGSAAIGSTAGAAAGAV